MNAALPQSFLLLLFGGLFLYGYILSPALAMYSWLRWSRSRRRNSRRARVSLAGLAVASFALLVGITCVSVSSIHHSTFLYLAPRFRFVYLAGLVVSAASVVISFIGALQSGPIRLKALIVALGSVVFWFLAGSGQ